MSVIVKGMKMPDSGGYCRFVSRGEFPCCIITGDSNIHAYWNGKKNENCPLVELPEKHGRLIEEPESFSYEGLRYIHPDDLRGISRYFVKQVKEQPTIFEAEDDMNEFEVGEYIIYQNGEKYELGRIASLCDNGAFVCYHEGETAAKTPYDHMHKLINRYALKDTSLGGGRFEAEGGQK